MSINKYPPCIRGLKPFEKKGCPQKEWDGDQGCPAWRELLVTPRGEPAKPKDKIGRCIDAWMLEFKLTELGLLEGNQQATESLRNGMLTRLGDGTVVPKADLGSLKLISIIDEQRKQQIPSNGAKAIEA
ncbi:MAG: hypothetical protein HKM93_08910 [Desulfobacteraceae bacterium]|nr:hypothetical protein [Desulfobacteraceae bacterium]